MNKNNSYGKLKAEASRHQRRAYEMWRLAVIRRGRIMRWISEVHLTRAFIFASLGVNVLLAVVSFFLARGVM